MASSVKNQGGKAQKLTRGFPANLGVIAAVNDVVAFTVPEPTRDNQGQLIIMVANGQTGATYKIEASLDGGVSWFDLGATITTPSVGDFGDTAASANASVPVSGFGSGAQFRFGISAGTIVGTAAVWALVG